MKKAAMIRLLGVLLAIAPVCALASAKQAAAPQLPRRVMLGAKLGPATTGVAILDVVPGGNAAMLGLTAGDVIVAINGNRTDNPSVIVGVLELARNGAPIRIDYLRESATRRATGKFVARPIENYANGIVSYGAYAFKGGLIRDIMVMPRAAPNAPVVFFLQGYSCTSIEAGDAIGLYSGLAKGLTDAGIGFYRVEKPGVGDSHGGGRCEDIDFVEELDAFRSAYHHLVNDLGVSPDRIFMLGHSLGGLEAPMLAAESAPRGVAIYGTVLKDWAAYSNDLATYQNFLINGADPAGDALKYAAAEAVLHHFYIDRWSPQRIVAADPGFAQVLREQIGWDGAARAFGRSYTFAQGLPGLPLIKSWRDTKSNVLSLYGGSDEIALFSTDRRMIAEIVNWYRPGTARFVEVPDTMHIMDFVGDRDAFRRRNMAAGGLKFGVFNPRVLEPVITWIHESMAIAPVRTRTFPLPDDGSGKP